MNAREYLEQVKKIEVLIDSKLNEIFNLKQAATSITAALKDDCIHGKGLTSDKIGNSVAAIYDLENEISEETDKLIQLRAEILEKIRKLDADQYTLIYKRYFQYKRWETIADEMFYTRQWLYKLHKKALKNLEKILGEK